jgi:hypothetical protein
MDIRDPESGDTQVRLTGPDEADSVWLVRPRPGAGVATVAGHRGAVGFVLQVTYLRSPTTDPAEQTELSARAERTARQATADWSAWLVQQLGREA